MEMDFKTQNGNGFQYPKWKWISIPKKPSNKEPAAKRENKSTCCQEKQKTKKHKKQKHLLPGADEGLGDGKANPREARRVCALEKKRKKRKSKLSVRGEEGKAA